MGGLGEAEMARWQRTARAIERSVHAYGYSSASGAFRQIYGRDGVDASTLLIPVMGFLPARDPRVLSTLDRLEERLGFGGWLHRFKPDETEGEDPLPLAFFEGAFVPCTCWMATARAMSGQLDRAEALLERVEGAAGDLGLQGDRRDDGRVPREPPHALLARRAHPGEDGARQSQATHRESRPSVAFALSASRWCQWIVSLATACFLAW